MAKRNRADYRFENKVGEELIKKPGSIAGNSFSIDKLHDCKVYILDHTTQVQVDDCVNCTIVVGPCDGSVFVRDCVDCLVVVAARQIRTRDCKNLELSVYCPTQPSIETSNNLRFTCWRGAYPGLNEHFQAAKLDPLQNTWDQVFNFNAKDEDASTHYSIDYTLHPFVEIPVEGLGPCENPVANSDGSFYIAGVVDGEGDVPIAASDAEWATPIQPAAATGAEPEKEDARAAWSASNNAVLQTKAAEEGAAKEELLAAAAAHRTKVAEARATATSARMAANRDAEDASKPALAAAVGENVWHRVMAMLDPTARVPQSDCARFKSVLNACRNSNKGICSS